MALTKISRGLLSTGVSDSSDATAITIDSSENVLIGTTSGSDPLVVSDSGASSITARFINTNADANPANIRLQKLSSSPADGDYLGMINVSGENDASEETIFQSIDFISTDVSDGTEDGVIAFRTRRSGGLAERMRIGTNVGIGVTSPDSRLQISNEDGSTYRFGYGGTSDIYFDSDAVRFRTDNGGANIAMLDTDGLKFGSDSATANALDDYEEGTFEADIYSGSTNQVILNAVDAGKYVKIGRFVFITIQIYLNSVTSFTTSSTNNYINLPFVSASDTFNASGFRPMYYNGMGTINAGYLSTNTNKLYLCTSQNNILANLAGATTIGGSVRFYGDMTYMSAS